MGGFQQARLYQWGVLQGDASQFCVLNDLPINTHKLDLSTKNKAIHQENCLPTSRYHKSPISTKFYPNVLWWTPIFWPTTPTLWPRLPYLWAALAYTPLLPLPSKRRTRAFYEGLSHLHPDTTVAVLMGFLFPRKLEKGRLVYTREATMSTALWHILAQDRVWVI